MSGVSRRAVNVAANAAGNVVNPAVAALMLTAATVTRNPELAVFSVPAGAVAGALTEEGMLLVAQTIADRADRVQEFADRIADETGLPIDDFVADNVTDGARRELVGHVVEAAAGSRSHWKITVLARAFVEGAKVGDRVEETLMFVELLKSLEAPHARLLAALHRSQRPLSIVQIEAVDPGLGAALPFLRRHLEQLDLVGREGENDQAGNARYHLTELGLATARWLTTLAGEQSSGEDPQGQAGKPVQ